MEPWKCYLTSLYYIFTYKGSYVGKLQTNTESASHNPFAWDQQPALEIYFWKKYTLTVPDSEDWRSRPHITVQFIWHTHGSKPEEGIRAGIYGR